MRAPFQVLVVAYRRIASRLEVAVLRRADHEIWQFISGGGEDAETLEQAARREGREEAGLPDDARYEALQTTTSVPACWFDAFADWPADRFVVPEHAFAVDAGARALVLSAEHLEVRWLMYDDAIRLLTFDSNRTALWELHERLYPAPRVKRAAFDTRHTGRCPCSTLTS